ncbi:MAG: sensor histidine kinase [Gaiellaceae bacterium]
MTLRTRLTLAAAVVVGIVVAASSVTVYLVTRHDLRAQVDDSLKARAQQVLSDPRDLFRGVSLDFVEIVGANGTVQNQFGTSQALLPIDSRIRTAASVGPEGPPSFFRDIDVQKTHAREIVVHAPGGAIVIAHDLTDVDHELAHLRLILLLVSLGGVGAAAIAGFLVSRATLAPVRRLTAAAERVAETRDPSERVPAGGAGELGRLGTSFNTMLAALEEAIETQRRFVADASHELRTPLTSMQTNIEVLKQQERLDPQSRERLFDDLQREAHEMRNLIAGLLELARGEDTRLEHGPVQLDELVENLVVRARSRYPQLTFEAQLEPTTIEGTRERLERAVWNLLENAGKWSEPGGTVEVTLRGGELTVRDHGPGIAVEDREHVFDRFFRSAAARSQPGSGLGLAIVREVAEAHSAGVTAEEARGGGALLRLRFNS